MLHGAAGGGPQLFAFIVQGSWLRRCCRFRTMARDPFVPSLIGETHGCWTSIGYAGKRGRQHMWTCRASCCGRVKDICTHTFSKKLPYPERCAQCYTEKLRADRAERRRVGEATGKWPPKYTPSPRAAKKKLQAMADRRMTRWEQGICHYCPRPRFERTHYCELHRAIARELARIRRLELTALTEEERRTRPQVRDADALSGGADVEGTDVLKLRKHG